MTSASHPYIEGGKVERIRKPPRQPAQNVQPPKRTRKAKPLGSNRFNHSGGCTLNVSLAKSESGEATMFHKTSYMRGFHIEATDGGAGHVDDFLVDEVWNARYLVVHTGHWPGGDSVLVPATAVEKVDPPNKKIHVKLTRAEVAACPLEDTAEIPVIETLGPTIM